ncbi:MAG: hypothetical protein JXA18_09655 [Chitinispirillaceae bacterium]|nr:hypothetical protein [Chitinispirillaceae bacterium]
MTLSITTRKTILLLLWALFLPAFSGALQQLAHRQYVGRQYREAATANLAILADTASIEKDRRYAMQMLGTIYEHHLLNFDSAIYWYDKFSEKYARGNQREFYRNKLKMLRGLEATEKKAYSAIQKATYATHAPKEQIELLEEGLSTAPSLPNREKVLLQLSHTAFEAGDYSKARSAMLRLKELQPAAVSGELRTRFAQVRAIWRRSIIARVCWAVIALLAAAILLTVPYRKITRRAWKMLAYLFAVWVPVAAAVIVIYLLKIHTREHNPFSVTSIFIAALILLGVAVWTFFARFSLPYRICGRWAVVALPAVSFLLTIAACFLFCYQQPKRVKILDEFGERYLHWIQGTSKGSMNEKED